jgi:hypothetical protein
MLIGARCGDVLADAVIGSCRDGRELADRAGLTAGLSAALLSSQPGMTGAGCSPAWGARSRTGLG